MAVAVLDTPQVQGEVSFFQKKGGVELQYIFTKLPPGHHGFHIHKAGDLRGEGCKGACDHWHKGKPMQHGGPPGHPKGRHASGVTYKGPRHTGDLGNLHMSGDTCKGTMLLKHVSVEELYGRSIIVHEDEDDYGMGPHDDSKTTGHSGARIACSIIGRLGSCPMNTRKKTK